MIILYKNDIFCFLFVYVFEVDQGSIMKALYF